MGRRAVGRENEVHPAFYIISSVTGARYPLTTKFRNIFYATRLGQFALWSLPSMCLAF
jgi:hypothetical protein